MDQNMLAMAMAQAARVETWVKEYYALQSWEDLADFDNLMYLQDWEGIVYMLEVSAMAEPSELVQRELLAAAKHFVGRSLWNR